MAKQGLAKRPAAQEIPILLAPDDVIGIEPLKDCLHMGGICELLLFTNVRLAQKLQPVFLCVGHELVKVEGLINRAQVVVEKTGVRIFPNAPQFTFKHLLVWVGRRPASDNNLISPRAC